MEHCPLTLTQSLVYLALAIWVARRMGIATHAADRPRPVLGGSERRV